MNILSTPNEAYKIIEKYETFYILGHKEPDGDCLGSQLALYYYLISINKKAILLSPGPFDRAEVSDVSSFFSKEIPISKKQNSLIIVVDCSALDRLGHFHEFLKESEVLVIDHHSSGYPFGSDILIDPTSPSTTFLIQQILESSHSSSSVPPSPLFPKETAWWLMFGFCTDTGFFRHLESGSAPYFAAISRLLEYGISPKEIFMKMYGGKHPVSRTVIGKILSRASFLCDGKLCICTERRTDRAGYGQEVRDSDSLYQLLLTVRDVEIIVYLREEDDTTISGGIRTRNFIDAGKLAGEFGGGGHKRAAGFSMNGDLDIAMKILRNSAEQLLSTSL